MMGILRPDLAKLVWAGMGLVLGPKLIRLVRG